jgi:hypothetical protein
MQIAERKATDKVAQIKGLHRTPLDHTTREMEFDENGQPIYKTSGDILANPTLRKDSQKKVAKFAAAAARRVALVAEHESDEDQDHADRAKHPAKKQKREEKDEQHEKKKKKGKSKPRHMSLYAIGSSNENSNSDKKTNGKPPQAQQQSPERPIGLDPERVYGPCTGHPNECGLLRHDWAHCPRNKKSPHFNPAAEGQTGPHPDIAKGANEPLPVKSGGGGGSMKQENGQKKSSGSCSVALSTEVEQEDISVSLVGSGLQHRNFRISAQVYG